MAEKVSYEHNNRLTSPLETAVWWVEHTIKTRGFELGRANTAKMNWFTYHSVDVIISLLIISMMILALIVWLVMQIIKCCCSFNAKKSEPNDATKKQK